MHDIYSLNLGNKFMRYAEGIVIDKPLSANKNNYFREILTIHPPQKSWTNLLLSTDWLKVYDKNENVILERIIDI